VTWRCAWRRAGVAAGRAALLAAVVSLAPGCYLGSVAWGQAGILCGRVPLEDVLQPGGTLTDPERVLLAETPRVLAFARERLGLTPSGSYRTFFDTGDGPVVWNVTACPKTSLKPFRWWFPLVGSVPYKGFFDREQARAEAIELAAEGLDVRVSEVPAYSTLGWFSDPVFRSMMRRGPIRYVETLLHETTHATIWSDRSASFNETLATFVGEEGAVAYLAARFGKEAPVARAARARRRDKRRFERFMRELYRRLAGFYARRDLSVAEKVAQRGVVFRSARERFAREVLPKLETQTFRFVARTDLNNCWVMLFRTYNRDLASFADVHALTGGVWAKTLRVFREAAKGKRPYRYLSRWRFARWQERLLSTARRPSR